MSTLYYVLGAVAKMNSRMWLFRINFLPINVLLIGGLAIAGFSTGKDAIESMHNASRPIEVSIPQINVAGIAQNYVTVKGAYSPVALYEYGEKKPNGDITTVQRSWTPLLDRASQRVLLVQRYGKTGDGDLRDTAITGMLRPLDSDLRSTLAARNDTMFGLTVETRYMLIAGARPANSMSSALISIALFAVLALFLIASVNRNTIFQRAEFGSPVAKVKTAESLKVGTTGTFALEQAGKIVERRFIDMTSMLAHLDNGDPAMFANIDASSRFMGVTTSNRAGIWYLAVGGGAVFDGEAGFLYWGTKRRPAYRFRYASQRGSKRQAIITTDDLQTLGAAVALLTTKAAPQGAPAT